PLIQEERHPWLVHHDLARIVEVAGILRGDLPHGAALFHLDAAEVLNVLRRLGQKVTPELLQRVHPPGRYAAGNEVADSPEGGGHHEEQRGAQPSPSHRGRGCPSARQRYHEGCRTVKLRRPEPPFTATPRAVRPS